MRFIEYLVETPKPKNRPNKTFWYSMRTNPQADKFFRHDIQHRMPEARFIRDEENEEIFAVSPDDEDQCFGVWRFKEKLGTTFGTPRSLRVMSHPRAKFSDYQLP